MRKPTFRAFSIVQLTAPHSSIIEFAMEIDYYVNQCDMSSESSHKCTAMCLGLIGVDLLTMPPRLRRQQWIEFVCWVYSFIPNDTGALNHSCLWASVLERRQWTCELVIVRARNKSCMSRGPLQQQHIVVLDKVRSWHTIS